jgi:hypothetical protein
VIWTQLGVNFVSSCIFFFFLYTCFHLVLVCFILFHFVSFGEFHLAAQLRGGDDDHVLVEHAAPCDAFAGLNKPHIGLLLHSRSYTIQHLYLPKISKDDG